MRHRSLSMTVNVSEQDIEAADQLLDNLLGANHDVVITRDVLFAFADRYNKSFFTMLGEALAGEILKHGTTFKFDVYALADDDLDKLHAAIANNPYQSHRLQLELSGLNQFVDDDLEIDGNGIYGQLIRRFVDICDLQRRQNANRVRIGFYQLQHGLFNVMHLPRDVQALILRQVANDNHMPQTLTAHNVVDQLNQIRGIELERRAANSRK